jgi:predicted porin
MKKTLIALAVLAASGASFAQVTITGTLAMGYKATTSAKFSSPLTLPVPRLFLGMNDASGFGVDTSEIDFMATEDLGGGMKATAKMGLAGADRSNESATGSPSSPFAVTGRDASLVLTGGFGAVALTSVRSADYLSGGVSGVAGIGFDDKLFGARRKADAISYSVPVGPVSLTLQHQEVDMANASVPTTAYGLGAGATGSTGQRLNVLSVTYAAGALVANGQYLSYDNRDSAVGSNTADYVTRASAKYDFGMVKLGLGYSQANYSAGGTGKEGLVGVSVPLGAFTVGAQWGQRKVEDANGSAASLINGTTNGTGLNASYALSKRTSVLATYARWDVLNASSAATEASVLVIHNF